MTVYPVLKFLQTCGKIFNDTFVDVGAYEGYYACKLASLFKNVIAIEANPVAVAKLSINAHKYNIKNMKILPVGVSDKCEESIMYDRDKWSTFIPVSNAKNIYKVKLYDLNTLLKDCNKIDLIKFDIEAYEEKAIKGGLEVINKHKPIMVIEHHEYRGYKEALGMRERIKRLLNEYESFYLNGIHWAYIPKHIDIDKISPLLAIIWFEKVYRNFESGKPWYYGLPEKWWWGLNHVEFMYKFPTVKLSSEWFKSPEP